MDCPDPEHFNTALVPCRGPECERFREEYPYCIMQVRAGKNGREYA